MYDIDPSDYNYKTLPIGASVKVAHKHCSSSAAMRVTVGVDGVSFKCFKCNGFTFVEHAATSYRDRKARATEIEALKDEKRREGYALPLDFSHTISGRGIYWLGLGGWTPDMIAQHNVGWSEALGRVVLPVQPEGYTARAVYELQNPKYLEKAPEHAYWRAGESGNKMVVVEDILSAGRISKWVMAEALLGTGASWWLPPKFITELWIWTDNDTAGAHARTQIKKRTRWLGIQVRDIITPKDPKRYSDRELLAELRKGGCHI